MTGFLYAQQTYLINEIKRVEEEDRKLSAGLYGEDGLYGKLSKNAGRIILEEKLLKPYYWTVHTKYNQVELQTVISDDDAPLFKLVGPDTELKTKDATLDEGINIVVLGETVVIEFEEPKMITNFIKTHELEVDTADLLDEINNVKEELAGLLEIASYLKLKY